MNTVDIWHLPFKDLSLEGLHLLNEEETKKASRFKKEEDTYHYQLSHIYLRKILTHYFPLTKAKDWEFSFNDYGKPCLSCIHGYSFHFNLSHCNSRAYVICSREHECGIDVEEVKEMDFSSELLDLVLSTQEKKEFLQSKEKETLFFKYWTLKEAHIKAVGKGLSLNMNSIVFKEAYALGKSFTLNDTGYYCALLEENYYLSCAVLTPNPMTINFYTKDDL